MEEARQETGGAHIKKPPVQQASPQWPFAKLVSSQPASIHHSWSDPSSGRTRKYTTLIFTPGASTSRSSLTLCLSLTLSGGHGLEKRGYSGGFVDIDGKRGQEEDVWRSWYVICIGFKATSNGENPAGVGLRGPRPWH